MRAEPRHRADIVDRELLDDIIAACTWWEAQRTWRVTSSYTGGGAIAALEEIVARRVASDCHALALPSATAALATALRTVGVEPGSTIGVPTLDWTGTQAVANCCQVSTVPLPVGETGLLDTEQIRCHPGLTRGLAAVLAVHLHGLTCDVPALRRAGLRLPVVEDAAQAWAARYPGGNRVGSAADVCVFSFGPAKSPSAGELGCLVTRSPDVYKAAIALTQHPVRQLLTGIRNPRHDQAMARVAPVTALLGAYCLRRHAAQVPALRKAAGRVAAALRDAGLAVPSNPALHSPGVVAVHARPDRVRSVVRGVALDRGVMIASIDRLVLQVHPDARDDLSLHQIAGAITVVTLALSS